MIPQSFEIIGPVDGMDILRRIEAAGRICYKSEARITETSARKFVKTILDSGHHSVIEHCNVSARIVTNRGVTHELVRHRLAAYSQESTRYVDYGHRNMLFIEPVWWPQADIWQRYTFGKILKHCAAAYKHLLDLGWAPQQAREVLPNGLKTEIVMTGNLREWRHVFSLRCSKAAHPQMRELMLEGLRKFSDAIPVLFDDLKERYLCEESSIISEPASTNGTA